jgi:predicted ATPase
MVTNLELEGFKSFLFEDLEFGKLTLLTGINSSGKSSVIQALRMLSNISQGKEVLLDGHGDYGDLINSNADQIGVWVTSEDDPVGFKWEKSSREIKIDAPLDNFPEMIYVAADRFGPEVITPIYAGDNYRIGSRGENIFKCIDHFSSEIIPSEAQHEDAEGDTFWFNLAAWLGVVSPNPKFKAFVDRKSDASYGTFNDRRSKNVGFGLSYSLPVITALLLGTIVPDSLVIIENPEAHLHPRGQTEIARLIAQCVEAGAQVIIETHSDHLFDGIRIHALKSESQFHELVKTYWFELDQSGNTIATEINIDEHGRLDNNPDGLFDQFGINARKLL